MRRSVALTADGKGIKVHAGKRMAPTNDVEVSKVLRRDMQT
jgi:hypothetical protein